MQTILKIDQVNTVVDAFNYNIQFNAEGYLILCSLLFLTYGIFYNLSSAKNYPNLFKGSLIVLLTVLVNFILVQYNEMVMAFTYFNSFFIKDISTINISIFACILTGISLLFAYNYNKTTNLSFFEFSIFILYGFIGFTYLICSIELISFYLLLELQGFSFYLLVSYKKFNKSSIESGIKYFILNSISSLILLLAFSFFYSYTGFFYLEDLFLFFSNFTDLPIILNLATILVFISFFLKLYIAPFHIWIIDIYQKMPTSSLLFISSVPAINLFFVFYKFHSLLFIFFVNTSQPLIIIGALCSMLSGGLGALFQNQLKSLLAYSSILNAGYALTFFLTDNVLGPVHGFFFICIYAINVLGVIGFLSSVFFFDSKHGKQEFINIHQLSGLFFVNPPLAVILLLLFFSLAGLPPFVSFAGKLFLLSSLMQSHYYYIIFFFLLTTGISAFFYIKVVKIICFNKPLTNISTPVVPYSLLIIFILILLLNIQLLINPSLLLTLLQVTFFNSF